jgi:alpha-methylacyl-CoA racemase
MNYSKVLEGIRVLDLSRLLPGPYASLVLGDLGAQVDKLEDAGAGDYLRHMPPDIGGNSAAFHALNRGKRSAVVNLKVPAGRSAFERLCGHYDVLLEQFRPGVLARLGLAHEQLLERHPRLIICALTGYGQTGPLAARAGHDLNYLARSGLLGAMGPTAGPPQVPAFQLADVSGGMWSVIAILAALRQREQSGQGGLCDIAMSEGVLGFASIGLASALCGEEAAAGEHVLGGGIAPYNTYKTSDERYVSIAALEPKFWFRFCSATQIEGDAEALFPGPHQAAWKQRLAAVFGARTRAEWIAFGDAHDCCVEPVWAPDEVREDPQLKARGLIQDVAVGDQRAAAIATPLSSNDSLRQQAPAKAGQDTRAIFREAGFSDDEVAALEQEKAIVQAPS